MERYAIIIRPNDETVLLHCHPGDSLDLKTLQEIVEGHIETVPTVMSSGWSKEKDVGHISMTHAFLCTYLLYCELCKKVPIYSCNSLRTAYPFRTCI